MTDKKMGRPALLRRNDPNAKGIVYSIHHRAAFCKRCWTKICLTAALGCSWLGLLAFCEALTGGGIAYLCPAALAVIAVNACLGGYYTARRIGEETKR